MSDDLLDQATRALARDTHAPVGEGDRTLQRILDTLEEKRAHEPPATGTPRTFVWAAAAALVLAAFFGGPTAWAWSVGVVQSILAIDAAPPEAASPPAPVVPGPTPVPITAPEPAPRAEPEPAPSAPPEPAPARVRRPAPRAEAPAPELDPAIREERRVFETAHHLHFGAAARERTLAAWNDYLGAYPAGRYAPEARWNRALTLVRLGRTEAARRELDDLTRRGYRAAEAAALLEALDSP